MTNYDLRFSIFDLRFGKAPSKTQGSHGMASANRQSKIGNRKSLKGVVLLFTLMVMITLTSIVGAYLGFVQYSTISTGAQISDSQAIYLAEAGLHHGMYSLKQDSGDSGWTGETDHSLGEGAFTVTATSLGGSDYRLTSTGTVNGQSRTVRQDVTLTTAWHPAFDYAIYGNDVSDKLELKNNVTINGHLYYDFSSGTVDIEDNATVNNDYYVYADSVSGDGIQAPSAPDPVPTYPTFATTWYDSQISIAEGASGGNDLKLEGSETFDLGGGTYNYDKVEIKDSASITGSGTIIAKEEVKLEDNAGISSNIAIYAKEKIEIKDSTTIAESATIVSKKDIVIDDDANLSSNAIMVSKEKIEVKKDAIIQSGAVLYGKKEVKLKDNARVTGSLIAPTKKVKMEGVSILTGIIYASEVELKGSSTINGAVVADTYKDDKIEDDVTVNHNSSYFPASAPTGLEAGTPTVAPKTNTWQEI